MGRMAKNIQAIGSSGYFVTLAGGDLYRMAEQAYGDASEWATIAAANGMTDPVLSGLTTVLVPPVSADTQGVLTDLRPTPTAAAGVAPFLDTRVIVADLDFTNRDNSVFATVI